MKLKFPPRNFVMQLPSLVKNNELVVHDTSLTVWDQTCSEIFPYQDLALLRRFIIEVSFFYNQT